MGEITRGGPDWFRGWEAFGVGIRLRVFPAYGSARRENLAKPVPAGKTVSLGTVSGMGEIFGGYVLLLELVSHAGDRVELYIDGETMGWITFANANLYGFDHPYSDLLWISQYDDVGFKYCMNIAPGFTFEESVEVKYRNNHATDAVNLIGFLYYAVAP